MDLMNYPVDETLDLLPNLLRELRSDLRLEMRSLTGRRVVEALPSEAGVHRFCQRTDGTPIYVGRSASLPQRAGRNHRATE